MGTIVQMQSKKTGENQYPRTYTKAVMDDNATPLDTILQMQDDNIGVSDYPEYSESETCSTGDVRKHSGYLYTCIESTTGAWDATKWKQTNFKTEMDGRLSELGSEVFNLGSEVFNLNAVTIGSLNKTIDNVEYAVELKDGYIREFSGVGDATFISDITIAGGSEYVHTISPVKKGERFFVKGRGGESYILYAFLSNKIGELEGKEIALVLERAESNYVTNGEYITAPEDGYLHYSSYKPDALIVRCFTEHLIDIEDLSCISKSLIGDKLNDRNIGFYNTSGSVLDWSNITNNAYIVNIVNSVSEGDKYLITGRGGSSWRLWAFVDVNNNIIEKANDNEVANNVIKTVPRGAYKMIVHFYLLEKNYLYKLRSIFSNSKEVEQISKDLNEKNVILENEIKETNDYFEGKIDAISVELDLEKETRSVQVSNINKSIEQGVGTTDAALLPNATATSPSTLNGLTEKAIVDFIDLKTKTEGELYYVRPEWFGAKGDGETDDTEAINEAISTRKPVYLTGIYLVDGITFVTDTTIIGGVLKAKKTQNGQSKNILTSESNSSIIFKDVEFDGGCDTPVKGTTNIGSLIKVWNAKSVKFLNCIIHNHANGIEGETYVEIAKRQGVTISLYNNQHVIFDCCEFYGNMTETVFVGGYHEADNYAEFCELSVRNCYSHDNFQSQALFTLLNLKSGIFEGNNFTENGTSFVNLISSNIMFNGNIFDGSGKRGIGTERLNWARISNTIVTNNVFKNCQDRAIEIGIEGCIVTNNVVENCLGFDLSGCIKNYVSAGIPVLSLCPFLERMNNTTPERGLLVDGNKITIRDSSEYTNTAAIRICGSYDANNPEDKSVVEDVNIINNKIYGVNNSYSFSAITFVNTDFKRISITDNYIESKNLYPSFGYVRFHSKGYMNNIRIANNILNQKQKDSIGYVFSLLDTSVVKNVFINGNMYDYPTADCNGVVDNIITDNNIVLE